MDSAAWGWVAFGAFLVPFLAVDLWLKLSGKRTYSQALYQWNVRAGGWLKVAFVAGAAFLTWHFFG